MAVRREVRTLTPACRSGQSKRRVDLTRVCVSVCVCACVDSARYHESAHAAQRRGGFVSAVGLVWNNKPPAFWLDSREGEKKSGSNRRRFASSHLPQQQQHKKKILVQLFCAHSHTKGEGWCSGGPGRGNYLISFISRRRNTNNCFSLSCIAPQRLTTPVICALRILIRPDAALSAAYSVPCIHAN